MSSMSSSSVGKGNKGSRKALLEASAAPYVPGKNLTIPQDEYIIWSNILPTWQPHNRARTARLHKVPAINANPPPAFFQQTTNKQETTSNKEKTRTKSSRTNSTAKGMLVPATNALGAPRTARLHKVPTPLQPFFNKQQTNKKQRATKKKQEQKAQEPTVRLKVC